MIVRGYAELRPVRCSWGLDHGGQRELCRVPARAAGAAWPRLGAADVRQDRRVLRRADAGVVMDDRLYFRVDDDNRAVFREAEAFPPLNYHKRAAPSTSPFGARRSGCSTNPMSSSPGREPRWAR